MTRRIAEAALALATLLLMIVSNTPVSAAQTTGFVSRSGTQLVVGRQTWRFAGYNLPCAQPFLLSDSELGYYLDDIKLNSGANVVRMWFFQSNGGPGNWAPFDRVIAAAKSRGMRIMPTLVNEWNACEPTPTGKLLSWYKTGYTQTNDGYPLSYRAFATQVAAHYAANPTIAFWQLVNEAEAQSVDSAGHNYCDEAAATATLRAFSDDMANAIHQVDRNHLVNLGTLGSGQCGAAGGADYRNVHAGALDLCEYHDYAAAAQAMPSDGYNRLKERIADCHALGKPIFVGESGISGNVQADGSEPPCPAWPNCSSPLGYDTLQNRADFFQAKIQAANSAGIVGYVIWFKSPYYGASGDRFAIGDGEPTEGVLKAALVTTPPAVVPEAGWPVLLIAPMMVVVGVLILRRRRLRPAL